MKTSTISSLSISNAMQLTVQNAQKEMVQLQQEAVSGTYYDVGVSLGVNTSQSLNFSRESDRLKALIDANALAEQRMDTSQLAMTQMSKSAQNVLNTFVSVTSSSDSTSNTVAANTAKAELEAFVGYANTTVNGEFVFSGINTDAQPLASTFVDDVTADFNTQLSTYLSANSIASVSDMSATDMQTFLNGYTSTFDWSSWTNASDTEMSSRISTTETVKTSTSLNDDGFKNFVMAAVIGSQLGASSLDNATRAAVTSTVTSLAGAGVSGVDSSRSQLGLSQSRVENANTSMDAQKTIIDTQLTNLIGIDKYAASTRLTTLLTQVETSYKITSRIQNLSLVNYL